MLRYFRVDHIETDRFDFERLPENWYYRSKHGLVMGGPILSPSFEELLNSIVEKEASEEAG